MWLLVQYLALPGDESISSRDENLSIDFCLPNSVNGGNSAV
jgi:hypothetical protein